jgi:hypothetical protein
MNDHTHVSDGNGADGSPQRTLGYGPVVWAPNSRFSLIYSSIALAALTIAIAML